MKKKRRQALVEIALALPILVFLLCGIIDFGRILYAGATLNIVSQEAVRYAGLGKKDSEVIQFAKDKTVLGDKNTMVVTVSPTDTVRKSGDYVTVNIKYDVKYVTPVMNVIIPSPFTINTKSTIRVE